MKSYPLQVNGWNRKIPFWEKLARLRRTKIVCFTSCADFRSKANAAMRLDLDRMTRGEHIWEICKGVENPKHKSIWCPHSKRTNTETLKRQSLTWEWDQ
jgi:hypothetical protein